MENLRQMCVWQQASATAGVDSGAKWWAYAAAFTASCGTPATWTAACSYGAMRSVGIDPTAVQGCVAASNASAARCASTPGCAEWTNTLLQGELDLQEEMGVFLLPSARVENVLVTGSMAPRAVLGAICAAFPPPAAAGGAPPATPQQPVPPVCACQLQPTEEALLACAAGLGGGAEAKTPAWAIALGVLGAAALAASGAALWWVRRTRQEVGELAEQYAALPGSAEGAAARPAPASPPQFTAGGGGGWVMKEGGGLMRAGGGGAGSGAGARGWLQSMMAVPAAAGGGGGGGWTQVPTEAAEGAGGMEMGGGSLNALPPAPPQGGAPKGGAGGGGGGGSKVAK